jgi:PIN domain nuclease of toxin-antitoxin system
LTGLLLDTHALFWLVSGEQDLSDEALIAIGQSQAAGTLFVSPISAWELAVASKKSRVSDRPHFGDLSPEQWFREAVKAIGAQVVPIRQRISCEAARVITLTGHKDPGDCFLVATARARKVPLATRDGILMAISEFDPAYLSVVVC